MHMQSLHFCSVLLVKQSAGLQLPVVVLHPAGLPAQTPAIWANRAASMSTHPPVKALFHCCSPPVTLLLRLPLGWLWPLSRPSLHSLNPCFLCMRLQDARGVFAAREFVWWYNGHPDATDLPVDLSGVDSVAVCGIGNVALDCARVLLRPAGDLATTDIAGHALEQLRTARVKQVHLFARRGPVQVRCGEWRGVKGCHACIALWGFLFRQRVERGPWQCFKHSHMNIGQGCT